MQSPILDLPTHMLSNTEIPFAWKLGYISSFYVEPFYRELNMIHGISRPEYVILFCLQHSPGASAKDIAETTGRPKNSLSMAIGKLEKKGLLQRSCHPLDPRILQLTLTPQGANIYTKILKLLQAREAAMLATLTRSERTSLNKLLQKIAQHAPSWSHVDQESIKNIDSL